MKSEALRRAFADQPFSAAEAREVLGIRAPYSTLARLKEAGIIQRVGRGAYRFAPLDAWQRVDRNLALEQIRSTRADREETLALLGQAQWQAWIQSGWLTPVGRRRFRIRVDLRPVRRLNVRRK